MTTAQFESSVSAIADRNTPRQGRSFATMMVHVDVARDCEQRVQLALALAHRFEATLIGVAGLPLHPAFAAGGVVLYHEPSEDHCRAVGARLDRWAGDSGPRASTSSRLNGGPPLSCRTNWSRGKQERRISYRRNTAWRRLRA
jgi:hypothetical protein